MLLFRLHQSQHDRCQYDALLAFHKGPVDSDIQGIAVSKVVLVHQNIALRVLQKPMSR